MIYLAVFVVSLLYIYLGLRAKRKALKRILIIIGLLIPCIVAGLRAVSVGTDTSGYVYDGYRFAVGSESIKDYFDSLYGSKDIAYYILSYVIAKMGLSFQVVLFVNEVLMIFPIFLAIYINRKKDSDVILGMTIFYLFAFNLSLNMVRQMIALALVLLSFSIFINKTSKNTKKLGLISMLAAIGFHKTAIVSIPFFIIYKIFQSDKLSTGTKKMIGYITLLLCALAVIFYKQFFTFLTTSGIYPRALTYIERYGGFNFNTMSVLTNVVILVVLFLSKKSFRDEMKTYWFSMYLAMMNFILSIFGLFVSNAQRVAYYMLFLVLFMFIPRLSIGKSNNTKYNVFIFGIIVAYFIGYWLVMTLLTNRNETLPYVLFYNQIGG